MDGLSLSLLLTATGVGLIHTLLGPDHYVPFLAMARAQRWSWPRAMATVGLCGTAHVLGSVGLGSIGVALGIGVGRIKGLETGRGDLAAWLTVAFGLAYAAWGLRIGLRRRAGIAAHAHGQSVHIHSHGNTAHHHEQPGTPRTATFWALLVIFTLGPCEPLIPLFVLPASRGRWDLALATALVFGVTTVATMLAVTAAGLAGAKRLRLGSMERWAHGLAGATVAAAGLVVITLGL